LTVVTILLVGLVPAWRGIRTEIAATLKGEYAVATNYRFSFRDFLIVAQVAISLVVLISAALLVRTFVYSFQLNPGFDAHKNVATFYLSPRSSAELTYSFFERLRQNTADLPGVRQVSYAIRLPAQANESGWAKDFTIPGKQPPARERFFRIKYTMV